MLLALSPASVALAEDDPDLTIKHVGPRQTPRVVFEVTNQDGGASSPLNDPPLVDHYPQMRVGYERAT